MVLTNRLSLCLCVLSSVVVAAFPHAQTSMPAERFEVASVKPYKGPLTMISSNTEPGGRFVAQQQSLKDLVTLAYRVRDSQILGGPSWIASDRFDVNAMAARELPPFDPTGEIGPLERMLQSLLADRFKLVAHRETRELPIFALVMARSDGRPREKLGEKLRPSSTDCASVFADRARAGQPGPLVTGDRPTCGMVVSPWSIRIGGGPLSQLTTVLTNMTNRFVVDRTGLTGNYDVDLQWTPQGMLMTRPPGDNPPGPAFPAPPPDANGATLETAIQEQLGLKLDPQRGFVPVLVIDRAERPSSN
jgi:bla regulator protein blaR1